MGTHPIFESDFDCLTDRSIRWFLRDELHSFLDDDLELAPVPLPTRASRTMLPSSDRMALSMCSRNGPRPSELFPDGSDDSTSLGGSGSPLATSCSTGPNGLTSSTTT